MNTNEKTHATVPVYTRLDAELAQRLQQEARDADRTMCSHVRHLIKRGLNTQAEGA